MMLKDQRNSTAIYLDGNRKVRPTNRLGQRHEILVDNHDRRQRDNALGGGIMKRQGPQQPIINHIDVKSVDEYSSKVQQLGGTIHVPKQQFQEWVTSQFVLIQRIMHLEYGRQTKTQSELSVVS
jgi:hypothetical protein